MSMNSSEDEVHLVRSLSVVSLATSNVDLPSFRPPSRSSSAPPSPSDVPPSVLAHLLPTTSYSSLGAPCSSGDASFFLFRFRPVRPEFAFVARRSRFAKFKISTDGSTLSSSSSRSSLLGFLSSDRGGEEEADGVGRRGWQHRTRGSLQENDRWRGQEGRGQT